MSRLSKACRRMGGEDRADRDILCAAALAVCARGNGGRRFRLGEASLEGHAEAVDGAYEALRDRFVGQDASRIEDIWQVAYRSGFYRGVPGLMSALSGIQ